MAGRKYSSLIEVPPAEADRGAVPPAAVESRVEEQRSTGRSAGRSSPSPSPSSSPSSSPSTTLKDLLHILHIRAEPTAEEARVAMQALTRPAARRVLRLLTAAFSSQSPGAEPRNEEAKRQLISFCSSLRNTTLPAPPPLRQMRSVTSFTPHFAEEVSYSMQALEAAGDDNTTMLAILRALPPLSKLLTNLSTARR